jgi:hypothetical protein
LREASAARIVYKQKFVSSECITSFPIAAF